MSSVVEICNIALSNVRGRSINELNESSVEAQQCKLHYATLRDTVLRAVDWQFAKKTIALSLLTSDPLEWTYAYQYPNDCLKMRRVVGDYFFKRQTDSGLVNRASYENITEIPEDPAFELENIGGSKVIVTDQAEAYGIYTLKVTDPAKFDPLFVQTMAWLLASQVAVPVIGGDFGRKMRADALQMYQSMLESAVVTELNERKRPKRRSAGMVSVRG